MSGYIDPTDDALHAAMIAHASDIEEMAIARAKELRKSALRQLWYKRRDALADSELDELRTHLAKLRGASQEELASEFGVVSTAELKRAILRANGNMSEAARALGVGRATLYRRLKRLGMDAS